MKISNELNERIKAAVRQCRSGAEQPGPVEVWWQYPKIGELSGEPWYPALGAWGGDLLYVKDLRSWVSKHALDGRMATLYCCGESVEVELK